ncbi:putative ribonuclease H-like domain-containing protein [Tanacetum coccineum]
MDNVRPRGSYSPIKRSYYTKPTFRPKDLKQDVKTFGVQNMTTAGTRAVVNTGKGKMYTDLKKSRWVWRPKGNYMDHESKESGSFMLKKFEYVDPKGISMSIMAWAKFEGNSDEGYFLRYSTTSKAFRVYNKRTKRVEENLHIDFLEDQPNVAGTGPNWMFDLDFLTNSMNYIPVSVENQVNVDAGTQDSYVAGSSGKDKEPTQEYILLPLHPHRTRIPVEDVAPAAHEKPSESSPKDNDVQDSEDVADKEGKHQMKEEKNYASTPTGANAGESSFVYLRGKIPIDASTLPNADLPINLNMPDLEDDSDAFLNDGIFNEPMMMRINDAAANSKWADTMETESDYGYGFNFMNTRIHIDNESTISVIKNPVAHSRTKHIEIQFHFIRDCYEKRLIEVIKIHTDSNVADLLTKGFDVTRFNFLVVSIGMLNL